ncbi:MAG TPA: aminodeoxychorismate/anthranilate synthase component II [Candidatus Eremiobacteraceae bacterium]|nr:aminodeoxychorismate/anthranilate synthase component II [Candidatus Eremiobacteraceae bacterium]
MTARVLIADNYDSFTFNLAQAFGSFGADVSVVRSDAIDPGSVLESPPHALVISPGPGRPEGAGASLDLIATLSGRLPILGVCLGHQAIGAAFGGRITGAPSIVHGKTSRITHEGGTLFEGVPSPFLATRYHSLVVDESSIVHSALRTIARSQDGLLMAIAHSEHPTFGVQFHPESVLTRYGARILRNFLALAEQRQ